jgi:hypothetical protein
VRRHAGGLDGVCRRTNAAHDVRRQLDQQSVGREQGCAEDCAAGGQSLAKKIAMMHKRGEAELQNARERRGRIRVDQPQGALHAVLAAGHEVRRQHSIRRTVLRQSGNSATHVLVACTLVPQISILNSVKRPSTAQADGNLRRASRRSRRTI